MYAAELEKQLNEILDVESWTVQDRAKLQVLEEYLLDFLDSGQLQKSKHRKLVDTFGKWVQQDPFSDLALPVASEIRDSTNQEE